MIERKKFEFLVFDVEVILREDVPKGFSDCALGGVYDVPSDDGCLEFKVWFKGVPAKDAIVHECWHLFMHMMADVDGHDHTFLELNNEIYAYSFHTLYNSVVSILTNMKLYKKLYDEEYKNKD